MDPAVVGSSLEQELSVLGLMGADESMVSAAGAMQAFSSSSSSSSSSSTDVDVDVDVESPIFEEGGSQLLSLSSVWQHNISAENNHPVKITLVSTVEIDRSHTHSIALFLDQPRQTRIISFHVLSQSFI